MLHSKIVALQNWQTVLPNPPSTVHLSQSVWDSATYFSLRTPIPIWPSPRDARNLTKVACPFIFIGFTSHSMAQKYLSKISRETYCSPGPVNVIAYSDWHVALDSKRSKVSQNYIMVQRDSRKENEKGTALSTRRKQTVTLSLMV